MKRAALCFVFALTLTACAGGDEATGGAPDLLTLDGTVVYQELEGGFYGIVTARGDELLPTNLPVEFEEDGLSVRVAGRFLEDVAAVQMWGRPFEIAEITRR